MTKREWIVIGLVIGGGILLPILGHDGDVMNQSTMEMRVAEAVGPLKTVALDVTGMT